MAESKEKRIERLLGEGLERYGEDDVSKAFVAWDEVLSLDPGNAQAADYMQTAERRAYPRDEGEYGTEKLLGAGRELMADRDFEGALDLLRAGGGDPVPSLEVEATVELLRSRLLQDYRLALDTDDQRPQLSADTAAIKSFNLSPDAGFVLSLVDGRTSVDEVISLSGMDSFEALRALKGLVDAGIVSMTP